MHKTPQGPAPTVNTHTSKTKLFWDVTLCRLINVADVSKDISAFISRVKKPMQNGYRIHNLPERYEGGPFYARVTRYVWFLQYGAIISLYGINRLMFLK